MLTGAGPMAVATLMPHAPVAQLDRASVYETEGHRFESCRARFLFGDTGRAMSRENVELVEAAYSALVRRDLDGFLSVIHPDVEFRSLVAEAEGQTYCGHDGVRDWWDAVRESVGGIRYEWEQPEAFRDRGIIRVRIVGTIEGVEVPQTMWQAWRVRGGLICWWSGYRTEREALEAVGLRE